MESMRTTNDQRRAGNFVQESYHLPYYGAFNWRVANDRSGRRSWRYRLRVLRKTGNLYTRRVICGVIASGRCEKFDLETWSNFGLKKNSARMRYKRPLGLRHTFQLTRKFSQIDFFTSSCRASLQALFRHALCHASRVTHLGILLQQPLGGKLIHSLANRQPVATTSLARESSEMRCLQQGCRSGSVVGCAVGLFTNGQIARGWTHFWPAKLFWERE
jgi:hypothetical protein